MITNKHARAACSLIYTVFYVQVLEIHVCLTDHDPLERRICKLAAIGVSTRADDDDNLTRLMQHYQHDYHRLDI